MADTMLQSRMGYLRGNLTRCSTPLLSMQHGDRRGQNFPQNVPSYNPYSSPWTRIVSTTTRALEEDMQDTRIIETELRREAEQSYLSYAMSVIVGRALPDVRDGLKPVHRRILYAMDELGLQPNKPHRKCARVVGEVLGKYHPHGDTAVYDALVRMVQEFSMRIPLVDGHGNFGSLDDDPPAAMRYTECRLQPFAAASLLSDLRSETVDVLPNFDNSVMEPSVLPARIPNLLINGSQGIAVGIATRIPPHNLIEVMDGLKALIENPKISVQELMKYIPGPDFPTGGEILKNEGLRDAYKTGKGSILVRAKMHIEETSKKRTVIVISELPYQTNKASLVEQIANLVDDGKITGISDIRDESDRSGMRVVIEIKQRGPTPELIMNQLQKHTAIQARFSCNMIALVDGLPKTLTLKDFLKEFLSFREKVIQKRSLFEKEKASKRLHLVEGFLIGISNLDSVLEIIKTSKSIALAKEDLQSKFNLSSEQAEGLLGMTLRRFTSFENDKLVKEKEELEQKISEIDQLLSRKDMIHDLILKEGLEVAEKYGSKRRTEIVQSPQIELKEIDVIPNNPCIIVYSSKGYIKRMNPNTFSVQGLRGTGVAGTRLKDDESMEDLIFANDHDNLLFFTREGHVHSLPAYSIPSASRTASGTAITQLIRVNRASNIASVLPITSATSDSDVIMLTEKGQIKRTALDSFTSMSSRGLIAMKLRESDSLKFVSLCNESEDVLLTSSQGFALRFPVTSCPKLSTSAIGVKTMDIGSGSYVGMRMLPSGAFASDTEDEEVGAEEEEPINGPRGTSLVAITKKGMGKCIPIDQIRTNKTRTGKGIKVIKLRKGDELADTVVITDSSNYKVSDAVISTANGMVVRVPLKQIPSYVNRLTQGNSIVRIRDGDEVSNLTVIQEE